MVLDGPGVDGYMDVVEMHHFSASSLKHCLQCYLFLGFSSNPQVRIQAEQIHYILSSKFSS